jgi:hypothetical protein
MIRSQADADRAAERVGWVIMTGPRCTCRVVNSRFDTAGCARHDPVEESGMTKTEAQATDWDSRICVRCGQPPHLDEPCEPEGDERLGVDGWYGNEVSR